MALGYAAGELQKVEKIENDIINAIDNEQQLDMDVLIDYAKVINSYCDALDIMENYGTEQAEYEKVITMLSLYGESHPCQMNVTIMTYLKYAGVLWKQKKFKKSCEALKTAISFLLNHLDEIDGKELDTQFLTNQISMI